jgi:hypothetical protein
VVVDDDLCVYAGFEDEVVVVEWVVVRSTVARQLPVQLELLSDIGPSASSIIRPLERHAYDCSIAAKVCWRMSLLRIACMSNNNAGISNWSAKMSQILSSFTII